jgi:hypothetical protein
MTQEELRRHAYVYLPFTVPPGTTRIEVSYHHENPLRANMGVGKGNTIDIGVFDARGTDFLTGGFRGWSGSARSGFFLTPQEATPGYLKGPLAPGEWNLILGTEKLDDPSCRYWVDVNLDIALAENAIPDEEASPAEMAKKGVPRPVSGGSGPNSRRANGPPGWYRGDLHNHTVHSDGVNTVPELAAYARERGLDYLAITDHNTSSHHEEIARLGDVGILLIPGEEVTTYRGHANVWGLHEWLDFRCRDGDAVRRVMDYADSKGVPFSINHPKKAGPPWEFSDVSYRCMEVWQAPWRWYNWESLSLWEEGLGRGERIVAVGGSDTHSVPPAPPQHPHGPGEPTTWVYCENGVSERAVLDGICKGHVFVSEDMRGPTLILTARLDGSGQGSRGGEGIDALMGDTLDVGEGAKVTFRVQYTGPAGKKLRVLHGRELVLEMEAPREEYTHELTLPIAGPGYVRAEVMGLRGRPERGEVVHVMTNPVYLEVGGGT